MKKIREFDPVHVIRTLLAIFRFCVFRLLLAVLMRGRIRIYGLGKLFAFPRLLFCGGRLEIGQGFLAGKISIAIPRGGALQIGRNVSINDDSIVSACHSVKIGNNVLIGENVSLRDTTHSIPPFGSLIREQAFHAKEIVIGDDVWIGRGSIILPGVTISEGAVIGANAVVTKDVAAGFIVGGVPARVISFRGQRRSK